MLARKLPAVQEGVDPPKQVIRSQTAVVAGSDSPGSESYRFADDAGCFGFVGEDRTYSVYRDGDVLLLSDGKSQGLELRDLLPEQVARFFERVVFRHRLVYGAELTQGRLVLFSHPAEGDGSKRPRWKWRLITAHVVSALDSLNGVEPVLIRG